MSPIPSKKDWPCCRHNWQTDFLIFVRQFKNSQSMKNFFSVLLASMLFSFTANAQLSATFTANTGSDAINDAVATVTVSGGQAPYTYYWSQKSTPLSSNVSTGLTEGSEYTCLVTDAKGDTTLVKVMAPPANIDESINAFFTPIVGFIGTGFMYDPFAAMGIYDNKIYNSEGVLQTNPNGDPKTTSIPLIVVWLVIGAIFFTLRMKFINFRGVKHAIQLIQGKFDDPNDKGQVSHFQALTTALSGTVGLGNIAGVAVAIAAGGAGATFWMILAGLLGMASKFVECTLGVKYREIGEDGTVYGGPMYYLSKGLKKKGVGGLGMALAVIFAILCIGGSLGGGNMFQANQAFAQLEGIFPALEGQGAWFGIVFALLVGIVIIGGIKSIANVTDKIVPFMVGIYVLFALIIIGMNIGSIGDAFSAIFNGAFNADALLGGVIGVLIIGFQRAAFSNEAGVGSASIAHSAVKTNEPVSEGIVALLEPFIDTVVVCTMTALVLIFTGYADDTQGLAGANLTSAAFSDGGFWWFKYVLTVAIILFAFSTMISWSYYGLQASTYLATAVFGEEIGKGKVVEWIYKGIFLLFIVVGAASSLGAVIDFSDLMVLGMAFPNILGLYFLVGEVSKDTKNYFSRIKSGEIKRYK